MISISDYEFVGELLLRYSGLSLGPAKESLIECRLEPVSRSFGMGDISELLSHIRERGDEGAIRAVCEAMATHESHFFRDDAPFALLRDCILPELVAKRADTRRLRIWCAAAATGQEPYSIAMLLDQMASELAGWEVEILATDYSRAALARARRGTYNDFEVRRGLSPELLAHYFSHSGSDWKIGESLREAVTFRELNLLDKWEHPGRFDLILCRNVLLYFDGPTRTEVLGRMHLALMTDGYLLLGASETAVGLSTLYEQIPEVGARVYQPRGTIIATPSHAAVASAARGW